MGIYQSLVSDGVTGEKLLNPKVTFPLLIQLQFLSC
jgi:hypothetical protein